MGSRHAGFSSCGMRAQQLWLADSRVQAQYLWCMGSVAPWHVGSSWTRARTRVPYIDRRILNHCATREALYSYYLMPFFITTYLQVTITCCALCHCLVQIISFILLIILMKKVLSSLV